MLKLILLTIISLLIGSVSSRSCFCNLFVHNDHNELVTSMSLTFERGGDAFCAGADSCADGCRSKADEELRDEARFCKRFSDEQLLRSKKYHIRVSRKYSSCDDNWTDFTPGKSHITCGIDCECDVAYSKPLQPATKYSLNFIYPMGSTKYKPNVRAGESCFDKCEQHYKKLSTTAANHEHLLTEVCNKASPSSPVVLDGISVYLVVNGEYMIKEKNICCRDKCSCSILSQDFY